MFQDTRNQSAKCHPQKHFHSPSPRRYPPPPPLHSLDCIPYNYPFNCLIYPLAHFINRYPSTLLNPSSSLSLTYLLTHGLTHLQTHPLPPSNRSSTPTIYSSLGLEPQARAGHTLVFDSLTGRYIAFGGLVSGDDGDDNDNCVNDTWELLIEQERLLSLTEALSLSPRELRPPLSARGSGSVASTPTGNRSRSTSASVGTGASASPGAGTGTRASASPGTGASASPGAGTGARASYPNSPVSSPGSPVGRGTSSVGGGAGSPISRHSPRSPDRNNNNNNSNNNNNNNSNNNNNNNNNNSNNNSNKSNNDDSNNNNIGAPSSSSSPPSGSGLQATWRELHCTGQKPQARYIITLSCCINTPYQRNLTIHPINAT